jgi:hypothetical protein
MPCADCADSEISTVLANVLASPALCCYYRIVAVCLRNYKERRYCEWGMLRAVPSELDSFSSSNVILTDMFKIDPECKVPVEYFST